jgi:hypothetical protein
VVTAEMHRLDHNADASFEAVNALFAEVMAAVERRREEVVAEVKRKKDEKRKVLEEQLKIIHTEKAQVDKDVEVRPWFTIPRPINQHSSYPYCPSTPSLIKKISCSPL